MSKRARGTTKAETPAADDVPPALGPNLRRLRSKRGLSLEGLAQRSGVSRAMLGQVELGQSAPTINVLWKIARALDVPFSSLIDRTRPDTPAVLAARLGKLLTNQNGSFTSRALFPVDDERHRTEFYELRLQPDGEERATPHAPGTSENLVVSVGAVEIEVEGVAHRLEAGDAIVFGADVPHSYRNRGASEAVMYLVMTYAEGVR